MLQPNAQSPTSIFRRQVYRRLFEVGEDEFSLGRIRRGEPDTARFTNRTPCPDELPWNRFSVSGKSFAELIAFYEGLNCHRKRALLDIISGAAIMASQTRGV